MDSWLATNHDGTIPTPASRASSVWVWILRNASSIVVQRGTATTLAAQTVRIESLTSVNEPANESGRAAGRRITVFGVVGHPTVTDTNLLRDDRFSYNATPAGRLNYKVIHVDKTQIGQVQCECLEQD
jgi:hypothetical protein